MKTNYQKKDTVPRLLTPEEFSGLIELVKKDMRRDAELIKSGQYEGPFNETPPGLSYEAKHFVHDFKKYT